MKDYEIKNISELIIIIEEQSKGISTLFRGMKSSEYELIPSIGRCKFLSDNLEKNERRMFRLFKQSVIPFLKYQPRNDWEWLAVAQHYGLPTRLLDWTYNPLIAAFFAIEEECECDSIIYGIKTASSANEESDNPFNIRNVVKYTPPLISERINSQSGCFTVHPNPSEPYEPKNLIKIYIKNENRRLIKQLLFKLGIRLRVIYPGLDGIAKDLTYLHTTKY